MKHVFSNGEVPHLWAHKTQSTGRNSTHSLYFDGDTIFSYGSHFPIARHVSTGPHQTGERAVLFTTRDHSVTTSKHKGLVSRAIPHGLPVFSVPYVDADRSPLTHLENCFAYVETIEQTIGKCARARSSWRREYSHKYAVETASEYRDYIQFFAVPDAPPVPDVPTLETLTPKFANKREKLATERREEKERVRETARIKEQTEKLERWRQGEIIYSNFRGCPIALRIRGDVVETTMGAEVPIEHARRALVWVKTVMEHGVEFIPNGKTFHIGHYSVDRIETDGTLHAGCHIIKFDEIARLAPQLLAQV